jgi:hypothetical protein
MTETDQRLAEHQGGAKKRGRKPGQVIQKRADIPDEEFESFGYVPEDDRVKHKRRREERSEKQQGIDQMVAENYQEWVAAGMPTNWADMNVITWTISDKFVDDAEFMLRKAAALYGRKISWGQREAEMRDGQPTGRTIIPFCIIAKPVRSRTNGDSE